MSENAESKALGLLTSGRLLITWIDCVEIKPTCRGDSGEVYELGYAPGAWFCNRAAVGRCSHMPALMRVAVRPTARRWSEEARTA
jgi:hypothetical protein